MQRRSFLASVLAAGVAPAAVGSSILMPVKALKPSLLVVGRITLADGRVIYGTQPMVYWKEILDDPVRVYDLFWNTRTDEHGRLWTREHDVERAWNVIDTRSPDFETLTMT